MHDQTFTPDFLGPMHMTSTSETDSQRDGHTVTRVTLLRDIKGSTGDNVTR